MKKILFFIPILFLFLPYNVNALTQGAFSPNLNGWYSDANMTNSCPVISGTHFRTQSFTANNYGWFTTRFYQNIVMSTTTKFDYLLIDLAEVNLGGDNYITYYNGTGSTATQEWTQQTNDVLTVYAVWKRQDNNEYLTTCYPLSFNNNDTYIYNLYCPVLTGATYLRGFRIETYIHHVSSGGSTIQFGLSDYWNYHVADTGSDGIASAINSQTQDITAAQQGTTNAINSVNATLNDDSTSSSQSSTNSFFNNFSINNHGLSGVVLAPVNFIQSFTNTCQPVTLTLFNKDVPIPCGDTIFWGKSDSRISNFRNIWNVLIGGPIIYALLLSIYRSIHKAMDPDKNEEGGLDL